MATHTLSPLADCLPPSPIGYLIGGQTTLPCVGMFPYALSAGQAGTTQGAASNRGRLIVMAFDDRSAVGNLSTGRKLALWHQANAPNLTDDTFTLTPTFTGGAPNVDPPQFAALGGYVGMQDGQPHIAAGKDGAVLTLVHMASTGTTIETVVQAWQDDGGVFTSQNLGGSFNPLPATPATGDVFYAGFAGPSFGAEFDRTTGIAAGVWTGVWEYFDGTSFTALSGVTDATAGFSVGASGTHALAYTLPDDWEASSVNGSPLAYYLRYRVTGFTSGTPGLWGGGGRPVGGFDTAGTSIFPATLAVNVAALFGFNTQFGLVTVHYGGGGGAAGTSFVAEYFNGTAWTALASFVDGTTNFTANANSLQTITFTLPGDWALRQLTTDATLNLFWIRMRVTVFGASHTNVPVNFYSIGELNTGTTIATYPPAIHVSDDPGAKTPVVVGWGIGLPTGVAADATGLYTYWDPLRRIKSRRFDLEGTAPILYVPAHDDVNVTKVAQWSDASASATLVATSDHGVEFQADANSADTTIAIGVDGGPPVPYDETKAGLDRGSMDCFLSVTTLRKRMYHSGSAATQTDLDDVRRSFANRSIWSEPNDFHNYPPANAVEIAPDDGDVLTTGVAFADAIIYFKNTKIYRQIGEPSTGSVGLQLQQLSDNIGCIAKNSIVIVGETLYFLSQQGVYELNAAGAVRALPTSLPVEAMLEFVMNNGGDLVHAATAAWDPTRETYLLALPKLQEQTPNGEAPGQDINDGVVTYCRRNAQWVVWTGPHCQIPAMATVWLDNNTRGVVQGDYWGKFWTLTEQGKASATNRLGDGDDDVTQSGTATGGTGTTLVDTAKSFPVSGSDTRLLGHWIWIYGGTGAGQLRMVSASAATVLTTPIAWSTNPASGSLYLIGAIYFFTDTGDLVRPGLGLARRIAAARITVEENVNAPFIDLAADMEHSANPDFNFAGGTYVQGDVKPLKALFFPFERGETARFRIAGALGGSSIQTAGFSKPRIVGAEITVVTHGRVPVG